jgi:hypothetical protein
MHNKKRVTAITGIAMNLKPWPTRGGCPIRRWCYVNRLVSRINSWRSCKIHTRRCEFKGAHWRSLPKRVLRGKNTSRRYQQQSDKNGDKSSVQFSFSLVLEQHVSMIVGVFDSMKRVVGFPKTRKAAVF